MPVLASISLIKGPEKKKKKGSLAPFIKTGKQNRQTLHDLEEKKNRYSFETLPESNLIQGKKLLLVV